MWSSRWRCATQLLLVAGLCLGAGLGLAQVNDAGLPQVIRAIYLPTDVAPADEASIDSFATNLRDAGVNMLITQADEPTSGLPFALQNLTTVKHMWRAVRSADELVTDTEFLGGVFINLTTTETAVMDNPSSSPSVLDPKDLGAFARFKLSLGIAGSAEVIDGLTTAGGKLERQPQVVMLSPDLSTLSAVTSESLGETVDWLMDLAKRQPRRRIVPWVRAEAADSPDDLESAIRGSIELTGGVIVEVSTATLLADPAAAIRRGMQANYLLPEG